jgi:DNA repair protein RecO (recombination protein O)
MRSFKTEGIIIKRKNCGEADRMVTVFTKTHGKLLIKATGVRKITSRRSAHIELLNYSLLSVYKGRTYPVLVEAQVIKDFYEIKKDLTKVGFAYHICELVNGLCAPEQENEAVFNLLKNTLTQMTKDYDLALTVHSFEIELLSNLGFWHDYAKLSDKLDTESFIENILERKLKSKRIFSKLIE